MNGESKTVTATKTNSTRLLLLISCKRLNCSTRRFFSGHKKMFKVQGLLSPVFNEVVKLIIVINSPCPVTFVSNEVKQLNKRSACGWKGYYCGSRVMYSIHMHFNLDSSQSDIMFVICKTAHFTFTVVFLFTYCYCHLTLCVLEKTLSHVWTQYEATRNF